VDVVLGVLGHVVVDDVRDAGHVDAAGRDVGRHHDLVAAAPEALERLHALVLRAVGVEDGDAVVRLPQAPGDPVGPVLGPREDEHAVEVDRGQERQEELELLLLVHRVDRVGDEGRDRADRADLDPHRVLEGERGHGRDLGRHRRREEQRLAPGGHFWMIRFTSWMKPMSSMRSTSSRMRIWMPPAELALLQEVHQAAGVATTMSVPARSSLRCRP
jgi:hypothetical protein